MRPRGRRSGTAPRTCVALLRGINVGRAKRIAMVDLRALVAGLGYRDVRTLLNSGNVVFTAPRAVRGDPARRIEEAIAARLGVVARVTVLSADEVAAAVRANPFGDVAGDPSRLLVAVLADPAAAERLGPLLEQEWEPDRIAFAGSVAAGRIVYLWCPAGILASRLATAFGRALGDDVTTRNLATMTKLAGLAALADPARG